jgi:hypothetical protein
MTAAAVGFVLLVGIAIKKVLRKRNGGKSQTAVMRIIMRDGQYMRSRNKYLVYIPGIMDCVFPGSGSLLRTSRDVRTATLLMACSALVYSWYFCFFDFSFSYPFWAIRPLFIILFVAAILYSLFFAVRNCAEMARELNG